MWDLVEGKQTMNELRLLSQECIRLRWNGLVLERMKLDIGVKQGQPSAWPPFYGIAPLSASVSVMPTGGPHSTPAPSSHSALYVTLTQAFCYSNKMPKATVTVDCLLFGSSGMHHKHCL